MSEASQPGNNGPGQIISSVRSIRLAIFIITTSLIASCAVFNVITFGTSEPAIVYEEIENAINDTNFTNLTFTSTTPTLVIEPPSLQELEISPIYLFLCGLSLSAISAFLHAGFILKLTMMLITVAIQTLILYTSETFKEYEIYISQYTL